MWCRWYAAPGTVGGRRTQVLSGVLPDPVGKTGHQLDVVVFGRDSGGAERIIAIGEAKNHAVVGETGQPARPDPGSAGSARPSRGAADEITALHRKAQPTGSSACFIVDTGVQMMGNFRERVGDLPEQFAHNLARAVGSRHDVERPTVHAARPSSRPGTANELAGSPQQW
jgi:hypothetical protein